MLTESHGGEDMLVLRRRKNCRNVVFMLGSGIISPESSGSCLNEEETKSC